MNKPDGNDNRKCAAESSGAPDEEIPRAHFTPLSESERAAIHAQAKHATHTGQENRRDSFRRGIAWVLLIILILLVLFLALNGG